MTEMAILPSFTAEGNLLMKKALYYDFMLFRRNQKPFNAFLLKKGLRNTMYSPPKNVNGSVDPYSSMRGIIRYDDGLHTDLSPPNRFNPTDNVNLVSILERFTNPAELDQSVFNPNTSEQIDQGIKTLVANLTPGAPFYDCSTDTVMRAIMAGRFDEFLSDENKEDMMKICYSGVDTVPGIQGEEIKFPQRMRAITEAGFGGKNKRSKSKSKSKKTNKRSKRKSKSKKTNKRSKSIKGGGRVPASYVGSIQGNFINRNGQQLFRNPVGGIA